jgi:hypothetical protein
MPTALFLLRMHPELWNFKTAARTRLAAAKSVARPLPKQENTHTQTEEARTDIHSRVGLEPMVPVLELAKALHALGRATTVISSVQSILVNDADCSIANSLYPPSFLIRVNDGFGGARVYRREC